MREKIEKSPLELYSQELARALDRLRVNAPSMALEDLAKSCKNIEASFLPRVAGNQLFVLETKRRLAELMLTSATERECRSDVCQRLFDELSELGFANTEMKSIFYIIYARYCLDVGRRGEATRLLSQLEIELEDELRRGDGPVYRRILQTVQDVLGKRPR